MAKKNDKVEDAWEKAQAGSERIDRARPLRDQIYALIRRMILTGDLAPNAVLDEKAIAARLGVSRTPVREAVKKLSDENLVDVKAQSGTIVAAMDSGLIREAFVIRRALEVESIGFAAEAMNARHLDRLEELYLLHTHAIRRRRYVDAIGWDDSFHRAISEISNLPRLWRAIDISKAQLDRCRYLTVPRPELAQGTLEQHRAIIDALGKNDRELARRAMGDHLDKAYEGIVRFLEATQTG